MEQEPQTPQPAAPVPQPTQPAGEDPGKTLAIVGIVLAFVFSLAGLVVSIIANNKSKAAGFHNTLAKVGIWLNSIFIVLGLLIGAGALILVIGIAGHIQSAESERQSDSKAIASAIQKNFDETKTIPYSLADLKLPADTTTDPEGNEYQYILMPSGCGTETLCRGFELTSRRAYELNGSSTYTYTYTLTGDSGTEQ